jgi:hypothetical protein
LLYEFGLDNEAVSAPMTEAVAASLAEAVHASIAEAGKL